MQNTTNTTQTKFVVKIVPNDKRKRARYYDFKTLQLATAFMQANANNKQASYTLA
jgi:hypothetical protein